MARRKNQGMEISLFPFLSILACLIGALVLMITALTAMQTLQPDGRDPEEVARARKFKQVEEEKRMIDAQLEEVRALTERLEELEEQAREREGRLIQLRRDLELARTNKDFLDQEARRLQRQLEDLVIQMEEMEKEKPPMEKRIEELKAELAERQIEPDDTPPPVIVQPGGSGIAEGSSLFFVEATGAGIGILTKGSSDKVRISSGSIGADAVYNGWLERVAAVPKAQIIFLLRSDGLGSYNRAAGWAEGEYGIVTGKLPLPGGGEIDLVQFEPFMGQVEVPAGGGGG